MKDECVIQLKTNFEFYVFKNQDLKYKKERILCNKIKRN